MNSKARSGGNLLCKVYWRNELPPHRMAGVARPLKSSVLVKDRTNAYGLCRAKHKQPSDCYGCDMPEEPEPPQRCILTKKLMA